MSKKNVKAIFKSLEELKENGTIDEDLYHKCLIEQAYKFFKDDDLEACILAVGKCNPEYFKKKQLQHMEDDSTYKDMVIYLAYKFVQLGISEVEEEAGPTQPKGEA